MASTTSHRGGNLKSGIAVGIAIGAALGVALDSMAIGIPLGIVIGLGIGTARRGDGGRGGEGEDRADGA